MILVLPSPIELANGFHIVKQVLQVILKKLILKLLSSSFLLTNQQCFNTEKSVVFHPRYSNKHYCLIRLTEFHMLTNLKNKIARSLFSTRLEPDYNLPMKCKSQSVAFFLCPAIINFHSFAFQKKRKKAHLGR